MKKTAILRDYLERTVAYGGVSKVYRRLSYWSKDRYCQKVNTDGRGYASGKYISSVAAFAPVENPKISIFISIDEPGTGEYYAGQIAAPLAHELFIDIFNYMNSEISKDNIDSIVKEVVVPELRGMEVSEAKNIK